VGRLQHWMEQVTRNTAKNKPQDARCTCNRVLGVRQDMLVTCMMWSRNSTVSLTEVQIMTCSGGINERKK